MTDILKSICAQRHEDAIKASRHTPLADLDNIIRPLPAPLAFADKIKTHVATHKNALIAEIKRASPSEGEIRKNLDPGACAAAYHNGGATCLSVLTEPHRFLGHENDIRLAKHGADLPVLRKDFMLTPYQIAESRALGADAVLIIIAALSQNQAAELCAAARHYNLDILVEIHDRAERDRALELDFDLLGINNRDLRNMSVNLETSHALSHDLPTDITCISESGIYTYQDIKNLNTAGIYSFLVGTSLMMSADLTRATQNLLNTI